MKLGAKIFGALAAILILYLGIGFFLPGTWDAEVQGTLDAPPEVVFPFLNSPEQWVRWNAMPESGSTFVGPQEGMGAGLDWDDPRYGSGAFRITRPVPNRVVEYEVEIEAGALRIQGVATLEEEGAGSRIPLMGYAARGMGSSQAAALEASLDTLRVLLGREGRPPTRP